MMLVEIVRALGARRTGGQWIARCVAHEDGTPSLSIAVGDGGRVLFKCHAGCSQASIVESLKSLGLWSNKREVVAPHESSDPQRTAKARECWESSKLAEGSVVEAYIRARAIDLDPLPSALRFLPSAFHFESKAEWPAMVAAVTVWPCVEPAAVQRTYLRHDGQGKAPISPNKKGLGPIRGGAVQLAAPSERLAIAEGVEDALTVMQLSEGALPCWATLGAANMSTVVIPPLPLAADVTIIADNDKAGLTAAKHAAICFQREGRRVRIATPPADSKDFNEELRRRSSRSHA